MTEDALTAALARLDDAVARAERAAATRDSGNVGVVQAYARLEERHDALRTRVQETIERLDMLIDGAA